MLRRQILTTTLLFVAGAAVVATPASAARSDPAPPTPVGITFSPDSVSVAGLDLTPVTVAVHLTDGSGVIEEADPFGARLPYVALKRVAGGEETTEVAELALVSGTPQDGVWSATIQTPSTWHGRWEVSRLVAVDAVGNRLEADPRDAGVTAGLDVTGTHLPAVTMQFVPDPLVGDGRLTLKGRFYYADTGKGIPDQPIFFGYDNQCVERHSGPNGSTAADGTFSRVYPVGDSFLRCVGIPRPSNVESAPAFVVATSGHPRVRPVVTATASRTTAPPGTKITFTGAVKPLGETRVQLQQLRAGAWHTVATGAIGDGGRFTLEVAPTVAATYQYRAIVPNPDPELLGVSRTIVVRVTASGSGGGDGLPVTGPAVLPTMGGGLALVLVGVGLTLVGRRRRVP